MNCNYCKSTKLEYLLSDTNSTYTYCSNCKKNFDLAHKHIAIDALLKKLLNILNTSNEKRCILFRKYYFRISSRFL